MTLRQERTTSPPQQRATMGSLWHDLEYGGYRADLGLWHELATLSGDPLLEVGAGTGRVALELARRGHEVTALDIDPELLGELERRKGSLPLTTALADAREFDLQRHFALCLAPMQTIQLLGGRRDRTRFLGCLHRHLRPGGRAAIALVEALETYDPTSVGVLPPPDTRHWAGTSFASQPVAVRREGKAFVLERLRTQVGRGGRRWSELHRVRLDPLRAGELEAEARGVGFRPGGRTQIPATRKHSGSEVVMLDA